MVNFKYIFKSPYIYIYCQVDTTIKHYLPELNLLFGDGPFEGVVCNNLRTNGATTFTEGEPRELKFLSKTKNIVCYNFFFF